MTTASRTFIFAIVCEELGLMRLLVLADTFIVYRGIRLASLRDRFGSMLAGWHHGGFGLQVFVNIASARGCCGPREGASVISAGGFPDDLPCRHGGAAQISRYNSMQGVGCRKGEGITARPGN
jgi:hypothetical protein